MDEMPIGMQHLYQAFFDGAILKSNKIITHDGDIFYAIYKQKIYNPNEKTLEIISILQENDCPDIKVLKFLLFREQT